MNLMQNVEKLVNVYDLNMGKRRLLEDIVMMVLSDDVFCVSLEGAVNKLIIVRVCCNQMEINKSEPFWCWEDQAGL